jgi:endoglycosylceramidase
LNADDIENMVKWGFNFVRLGVMWEAVEKTPGVYDQAYLAKVNDLINSLGNRGIYTMVDAHQDVFARSICGEGMPTFYIKDDVLDHTCHGPDLPWAEHLYGKCQSMKDFGFQTDANGNPLISECNKNSFVRYYSTAESLSAFEMLYQNTNGLQDKFLAYWDAVASYFATNPYVIGYDPINEPYPSNYMKDSTIVMTPGKFDKDLLQPMYAKVYEIYRKYSAKKIMYWEPGQFPDTVGVDGGLVFPLGFTGAPGGNGTNLTTQVLNDHSYCGTSSALGHVQAMPKGTTLL